MAGKKKETPLKQEYVVIKPFKDAKEYRAGEAVNYSKGDDVSHFEQSRLESAILRGYVSFVEGTATTEAETE